MNAYEFAKSNGIDVSDPANDADVVTQIKDATASDIPRWKLKQWLTDNEYWEWTVDGMVGDLEIARADIANPPWLVRRFNAVLTWLFSPSLDDFEKLRTGTPVDGKTVYSVIAKISTISPEIRTAYFELAGADGPYRTTTAQDIADQRAAAATAVQQEALRIAKQGFLAEANDVAQTAINNDPDITQAALLTVFTDRLAEVWQ